MSLIFSFSNQKGGVGKTTTAINIAAVCAKRGIKTILIDCDPQGNATSGIGIDRNALLTTIYDCISQKTDLHSAIVKTNIEFLDLLPANSHLAAAELELIDAAEREFVLKKLIDTIQPNYEVILIDCPPSLGLLTINALAASDQLIIPLQCEYYALEGLSQLLDTFKLVKENLNQKLEIGGVLLTMADFRTNLTQQVIEEVIKYFGEKTFKAVIPRSVKVSEAPSYGKPITMYDPSSKGAKAYETAGKEFINRFKLRDDAATTEKVEPQNAAEVVGETIGTHE